MVLHYRVNGAKDWIEKEDNRYPFEFSIPLEEKTAGIEWWIEAADPGSRTDKSAIVTLRK